MQKYVDQSPELQGPAFHLPCSDDIALYLHTSSASSIVNVKCVPISHASLLGSSAARLAWWKRTWPAQQYTHLRVLGWSTWAHVIGLTNDLGAAMVLTAGCYVFALPPAGPSGADMNAAARYLDVCGQLLETAITKQTTAFAGVPWVLEGFMRNYKQETDAARKQAIRDAIQRLKVFGSGGASTNAECIEWATQMAIPLVFDIGMTEVGGVC